MAVEKFSFSEGEGLIVCAGDGKFYIYRLNRQSDNKAVRELVRRRPLMVTMNSVELHALLKKYRLYEYRTADLKDMFTALNTRCALPCTYRALMENISGMDLGGGDFYLSAMEHYGQVYMSCLKKMTDNNVELFELYSCVSFAIGCSWDAVDIFRDISVLYKRKGLFEYQSECPENIIPDTDGSLYFYRTDDVPAKNERFYLGLVRELVRLEAVKLGKVLVLKISDRGLVLFAFETDGTTYELLQWPCVYLARKLNIKDSHVHYHRQVYVMTCCVLAGLFVSAMINIFVCQSVRVSGKSMEPSYHDGDRIVMEKISYRMGVPKRFDVVVFPRRENYYLVKRVIGLPGETVQISAEGDIFIDGRLLKEDYGMEPIGDAGIAENGIILGENEYFVLGDNRNHSADSRNTGIGNVSIDEITGKIVW